MDIQRRTLLAAGAAAPLLALAGGGLAQPAPGIRPKVAGMARPAALEDYKRAIAAMLALPVTDPRNWYRQALIHVLDCPHRNWWFLPWHRGYLARFEQICAELSGNPAFRLPYWDYSESPTVPDAFFDEGFDCGDTRFDRDPSVLMSELQAALAATWPTLTVEQRRELARRGLTTPEAVIADASARWTMNHGARIPDRENPGLGPRVEFEVSRDKLAAAINTQTFDRFASGPTASHHHRGAQGLLEGGPHNSVHGGAGGFMGDFMSPVDPLFWMHHANLDRLWDIWLRRWRGVGQDPLPTGSARAAYDAEAFTFFCDAQGRPAPVRAGNCLSAMDFGYGYEPGFLEELGQPRRTSPLVNRLLATSSPDIKRLREGFETADVLSLPRADFAPLLAEDEPGELVAEIQLTLPAEAAEANIRVYLNCPYLSRYTPIDDPHYAGTISFFGGGHAHGELAAGSDHVHDGASPSTQTVIVTLGPTLRALGVAGRLPVNAIRVQLMPESDEDVVLLGGALDQVAIAVR